jgi:hypothetical protein
MDLGSDAAEKEIRENVADSIEALHCSFSKKIYITSFEGTLPANSMILREICKKQH